MAPSRRNPLWPAVHRHAGLLRNSRPSEKRGSAARTGHELNITWLSPLCGTTLPRMQKRPIPRGRPAAATSFEAAPAAAFDAAVRAARTEQHIAHERLPYRHGADHHPIGKIERREHQPHTPLVLTQLAPNSHKPPAGNTN